MARGWSKRFLPRGLYGRAALILMVPVVTLQLVVSVVFIQRHFERVTRQMTEGVVREAAYIIDAVTAAPTAEEARGAAAARALPLGLGVALPAAAAAADRRDVTDLSGRAVIATLREGLADVTAVDLSSLSGRVILTLDTAYGPLALTIDRRRVSATNPHQLLVLMIFTGALMTLIAYAFLRNQVRPIAQLAAAADAFGRGQRIPFRVRGATEVRAAGRAFLDMRARIERQIEQRTLMLSGVSHDLRTPLTRLRLELSMLEQGPEVAAMLRDIAEMERMLDGFLEFAREGVTEGPVPVDPAALVFEAVDRAQRAGGDAALRPTMGAPPEGPLPLRPQALARALDNLIGNALRYGTKARAGLEVSDGTLRLIVEDDGPGIPEDRIDEALRPFIRLDSARNQNRGGGVGLGLAITAEIARAHGGALRLGRSADLGGLRAEIVLPL